MTPLRRVRIALRLSSVLALASALAAAPLQAAPAQPSPSQSKPKPARPAASKRPASPKQTAAAPKPQPKRPPLTKAEVQKLWAQRDEDLALNELRLRGLAFEPEEDWLSELPKLTGVPADAVARLVPEIRALIPPAPDSDAVAREAPALLTKLKEAAQKRSETDMEPLVHPELLLAKAKVYDLFDTTNYRNHALGKFSPQEYRRVGVQFFQLTTSQVEKLHYVLFATSHGKIVVRDVITGPAVADLFLRDEQKLALSKLDLVFRALNDGDDIGLKNLCTPGLYEKLKELAGEKTGGGARLTRGARTVSQIEAKPSVPLDAKSIRVVVRVGYPTRTGKKIQYDVDFERVDNDLKVVRLRDAEGRVIAWDPDIDNYLNRRFGLPDGPKVETVAESDLPEFYPLSRVRKFATRALEDRNAAKLKIYAEEFLESEPSGGTGYGLRAAANQILGNYEEAEKDATLAVERGGSAYFFVMRHQAFNAQQLWPVVLGVSKQKIEYRPPSGQGGSGPEDIEIASVADVKMEGGKLGGMVKARPFLKLEFYQSGAKRDKKEYNFAAFGSSCPGETNPSKRNDLLQWAGGSICPGQSTGGGPKVAGFSLGTKVTTTPMLVPPGWDRDLRVVLRTIEEARKSAQPAKR